MALVWLLSNCYQKTSQNAANLHKYWVLRYFVLFPLDGAGGFGGYIVNYAVYVFYLVCDTI